MISDTSKYTNDNGSFNYAKGLFKNKSKPELCPIKFAWDITARYDLKSCEYLVESGQIFYIPEIIFQS